MAATASQAPVPQTGGPIGPVKASERVREMDLLRGFAIFGILLVNMQAFGAPLYEFVTGTGPWTAPHDRAARLFIEFFAQAKFYTLFSFLFGLGFAVQLMKAEQRGEGSPTRIYRRRILVLAAIGAVHAFLIWMGDILLTYALVAWPMLLFRKASPKKVLTWAAILLLLPALLMGTFTGLIALGKTTPEGRAKIEKKFAEQREEFRTVIENSYRVYGTGSWAEITAQRTHDVMKMYSFIFFYAPSILGMFLLGLWAGRRGIFRDPGGNLEWFRKLRRYALPVALAGNTTWVWSMHAASPAEPSLIGTIGLAGAAYGVPAMTAVYCTTLILLWHDAAWRARLEPITQVGRMALSNYLTHSLLCTTIFYSYGLGMYGRMGTAWGLAIAVVIYAAQIPLSRWWLERYEFGPAEWLWRSLTYGRRQPMRRAAAAGA